MCDIHLCWVILHTSITDADDVPATKGCAICSCSHDHASSFRGLCYIRIDLWICVVAIKFKAGPANWGQPRGRHRQPSAEIVMLPMPADSWQPWGSRSSRHATPAVVVAWDIPVRNEICKLTGIRCVGGTAGCWVRYHPKTTQC